MRFSERLPFAMLAAAVSCYPATTRPPFQPKPEAPQRELNLPIPEATRAVAIALDEDSIPVERTEPKDGWLETGWFDAQTLKPTRQRPIGTGVVKLRAWIDPARPNYSSVTIETVYRPLVDPSRSERALETLVPAGHRVAGKVELALAALTKEYGGALADTATRATSDTVKVRPSVDSVEVRLPKSVKPPADTVPVPVPRDTSRAR